MTTPPAPNTPRIPDGAVLNDRYRITGFLGIGGHAAVYAALDTLIEREVAIKVLYLLSEDNQSAEHRVRLERFRAEARLAARIRHSAVVTIFDMGTIEQLGFPFIVMEHLQGHDLRADLRDRGAMEPERALRLIKSCLDALHLGHEQGVIHRDLKPANLFLIEPGTPREELRILDFGIARALHSDARLTGAGQLLGTPRYLAPEYIREHRVTPALDIYQIGLILAELLTGEPVLKNPDPMDCILKHTQGQLDLAPQLLRSDIGPIIKKATARKPEQRYASARELRLALDTINPRQLPDSIKRRCAPRLDGQDSDDLLVELQLPSKTTIEQLRVPKPQRLDATTELPDAAPEPRRVSALLVALLVAIALVATSIGAVLLIKAS